MRIRMFLVTAILIVAVPRAVPAQDVEQGSLLNAARRALAQEVGHASRSGDDADWARVMQGIQPETLVRLVLTDGRDLRGTFRAADADSITLQIAGAERQVKRVQVRNVFRANGTRRERNMEIGAAIGIIGAAVAHLRHCRGDIHGPCGEEAMAFYLTGGLAGGFLGSRVPAGPKWERLYPQR